MITSCNLRAGRADAERLLIPALMLFYSRVVARPCFISRQQSFWLICHRVLPVWTAEDGERFPFSCSQQGAPFSELPPIGNNKLALCVCVWHNLFSIQLEAIHSLIRLISKLPLCKSLGNKFTTRHNLFFLIKCQTHARIYRNAEVRKKWKLKV